MLPKIFVIVYNNNMNALRIIILILIFPLITVSLLILLISTSTRPYLQPETYQKVLERHDLYSFIEEQFANMGDNPLVQGVFENESAREIVDRLLENALAYARGDTKTLELKVELGSAVEQFLGEFEQQIANVPMCRPGQSSFFNNEPVCKPANVSSRDFLLEVFAKQGTDIPITGSQIDLLKMFDKDNYAPRVRGYIEIAYKVFYGALISLIVLLVAIFFLKRKSIMHSVQYVSAPMILIGLIGLAGAIVARKMALPKIPDFEEFVFARDAIVDIASVLLGKLSLHGGLLLAGGIILIVVSIVFRNRKK